MPLGTSHPLIPSHPLVSQIESSPRDAASYDVDDVFLERLERSLQGIETLPLEQNDARPRSTNHAGGGGLSLDEEFERDF